MNIKTFAAKTGLSAHTLRYYEKIGLLRNIQRSSSGHRVYSAREVDWVSFIVRLKETGMPLREILTYAALRAQGAHTARERQALLASHQKTLREHIDAQLAHLRALDEKISLYNTNRSK